MKPHPTLRLAIVAFGLLAASCSSGAAETTTTAAPPDTSSTTTTSTTQAAAPTATSSTTTTSTEPPVPPVVAWVDETLAGTLEIYAAGFEAATGIPVVLEVRPLEDLVPSAVEALAAGEGPDLFVGSHRWAAGLAEAGTIRPIPIPDPGSYPAEALAAFTVGGDLVGVPFWFRSPVLLANHGLVPSADGSTSNLEAVCEADGAAGRCLAVPSDDPAVALAIVNGFGGYGFAYGDDGFDPADIGLDSTEALAAADYLAGLAATGSLVPADEARELFASGGLSFLVDWAVPTAGPTTWSAFPFRPNGAADDAALTEVWGFMVAADGDQALAAQVLVTDFIARDNPMFDTWLADGRLPARTAAFDDAVRTDPAAAAFSPADRGPGTLALPIPESGALMSGLAETLGRIATGEYPDDAPDARTLLAALAARLRAAAPSAG